MLLPIRRQKPDRDVTRITLGITCTRVLVREPTMQTAAMLILKKT
jgi:hypothetical protein